MSNRDHGPNEVRQEIAAVGSGDEHGGLQAVNDRKRRNVGVSLGSYGWWPFERCTTVLALLILLAVPAAAQDLRPNIILIIADDLGYGDVGYLGSPDIRTPNIDRLVAQGVVMHQGFATASICSPSRAGMMTGKYQQRFGHENNIPPASNDPKFGLPLNQVTMADVMKSAGYTTAAFGKWHLGGASQFHPQNRGFDYFYGWLGSHHSYRSEDSGSQALQRNGQMVRLNGKYMTDAIADDAAAYLGRTPGPIFMHVAFNAPHSPLEATERYLQRYPKLRGKRRVYAAMVSALDDGVGKIVAAADRKERPAVIVFISDNGAAPQWGGSNGPLRGFKGAMFEGGIRVPWVMRIPGIGSGLYRKPVMSFDLLPTFAALAGGQAPGDIDGVNLLPYLRGGDCTPHERLFWRIEGGHSAARVGDLKTVHAAADGRYWFNLRVSAFETKQVPPDADVLTRFDLWEATLAKPLWYDQS